MSCKPKSGDDCKCQKAVMNAYRGLLTVGQSKEVALEAAKVVYHHHHPEDMQPVVDRTVEAWIDAGHLH